MVDYTNEIIGLINSLKNPRYGSQDLPHLAPILFDGVLLNAGVTFLAASDDPHDYGVQVWNDAQSGLYGAIAPYAPPKPPAPPTTTAATPPNAGQLQVFGESYFHWCMAQAVPDRRSGDAVNQAAAMLNSTGGKAPTGARGAAFASLAKAYGMSVDDFILFVQAIDDLRFSYMAAFATFSTEAATGDTKALETFLASMTEALAVYNETNPIKIKPPEIKP